MEYDNSPLGNMLRNEEIARERSAAKAPKMTRRQLWMGSAAPEPGKKDRRSTFRKFLGDF